MFLKLDINQLANFQKNKQNMLEINNFQFYPTISLQEMTIKIYRNRSLNLQNNLYFV